MMGSFSSAITATSPWFLAAIPVALGLLIYIFRVRGDSRRTVVSSLFLLRELPQRPLGKRLFIPPAQFWIELALFCGLSLAAAALFVSHRGEHIALLIDSSLSMGATTAGGTRLNLMKERAQADVASAPSASSFSVFSGASNLSKHSTEPLSKAAADKEIEGVALSYAKDSLQEHINQLLLDPSFDAVWVYTDQPFQNAASSQRLSVTTSHQPSQITHNVWIQDITRESGERNTALVVSLKSTFKEPVEVALKTTCVSKEGENGVPQVKVKALPGQSTEARIAGLPDAWNYCHVKLATSDSFLSEMLLEDNDAWVAQQENLSHITVRSPLSLAQLGLQKIPFIQATQSNDQANALSAPAIIHRTSLAAVPTAPTLLIAPPAGPLPWGGSVAPPQATSITRWDESHPVLRYVKPSLLSIPSASAITCPPSATTLLFSERGALMCAGESRGARYIISGIELFPFDGASSPTSSILLLNALTWLFSQSGAATTPALPVTLSVPLDTTSVEYITPRSGGVAISPLKTISAQRPGVLKITNGKGDSRFVSLNAFHEAESDLSRITPLEVRNVPPTSTALNAVRARALAPWLLGLVLVVATVDLVRRWRKGRVWRVS